MLGQCTCGLSVFTSFKTNNALRVQREALKIKAICDSATTVPRATVVRLIRFSLALIAEIWYIRVYSSSFFFPISKRFLNPTLRKNQRVIEPVGGGRPSQVDEITIVCYERLLKTFKRHTVLMLSMKYLLLKNISVVQVNFQHWDHKLTSEDLMNWTEGRLTCLWKQRGSAQKSGLIRLSDETSWMFGTQTVSLLWISM